MSAQPIFAPRSGRGVRAFSTSHSYRNAWIGWSRAARDAGADARRVGLRVAARPERLGSQGPGRVLAADASRRARDRGARCGAARPAAAALAARLGAGGAASRLAAGSRRRAGTRAGDRGLCAAVAGGGRRGARGPRRVGAPPRRPAPPPRPRHDRRRSRTACSPRAVGPFPRRPPGRVNLADIICRLRFFRSRSIPKPPAPTRKRYTAC